ncbi:MAG TPA: hypothetical protein VHP33_15655 [Polyangiaceae bacterium]|nr:hypothetical protein [Polyangiaceae bacterium]
MRCWGLALALAGLSGCGGKASSARGTEEAAQGGSAGAAQGSAAGAARGSSAGSAQGSAAGSTTESPPLDDSFPWFTGSGKTEFPSGQNDEVLHIIAGGTPAQFTLSTHNLYDPFASSRGIAFSARASAPTRLLVSASNSIQAYDYFAARAEGAQWPVASVEVGPEWRDFSVSFSDMTPKEAGDADGVPSFWLAFIVDHPEPVDVWLDEIRFLPKQ